MKKIVAYYRIPGKASRQLTKAQQSLIFEQEAIAKEFASHEGGKVVAAYKEVEDARTQRSRPQLAEAIAKARELGAILVLPKIDRLYRNVAFTTALRDSGVIFCCCDHPNVNPETIHMMAEFAESESTQRSLEVKSALAKLKASGVKLGSARPDHWKGRENKRGWKKGAKASGQVRSERAKAAYSSLLPQMRELEEKFAQEPGQPIYERIAAWLNKNGHYTTTGRPFNTTTVWRILKRDKEAAEA